MLRNRILTALILAPLVIWAVYCLDHKIFVALIAMVFGLAAFEWAGLCGWHSRTAKLSYVAVFLGVALALFQWPVQWPEIHQLLLTIGCLLWLGAICAVCSYPRGREWYAKPWLLAPCGLVVLACAWTGIVQIHRLPQGSHWIGWMLILVWAADIGAYFAGKAFGNRRLAPNVSPGKTWQGAAGGFVLAILLCGGLVVVWQEHVLFWLCILPLLITVSIFGDLFESLLKRSTGVKDSGTILPGHGGLLDRIDSMLAVLPVLGLILITRQV